MPNNSFSPDLIQQFPRLARPPIVEAVIHWQARAQNWPDQGELRTKLASEFPGFTWRGAIHHLGISAEVSSDPDASVIKQRKNWEGFRLQSDDDKYVIQFTRDGLLFSRVGGYDSWGPFVRDAKEAWRKYLTIAQPVEIQRLGVRFINQVAVVNSDNIREYLQEPPTCPENLRLNEFVYQSTFAVPDLPFHIRVIKIMQPPILELQKSSGLFLDIGVFTNSAISTDESELDKALNSIRWLKNRVFFKLLTDPVRLFGSET